MYIIYIYILCAGILFLFLFLFLFDYTRYNKERRTIATQRARGKESRFLRRYYHLKKSNANAKSKSLDK